MIGKKQKQFYQNKFQNDNEQNSRATFNTSRELSGKSKKSVNLSQEKNRKT